MTLYLKWLLDIILVTWNHIITWKSKKALNSWKREDRKAANRRKKKAQKPIF